MFVEAAGILTRRLTNENFKFLITSSSDEEMDDEAKRYKKSLEERSKALKIKLIIDNFKDKEIPILNNLADASVLPTRREGLGLVLLESMAARTPVVASNVCGVNEVIKENYKHGLLFPDGNHKELAEKLEYLFTNDDLYKVLVREGVARVRKHFNASIMAEEHLKLYSEMIRNYQ